MTKPKKPTVLFLWDVASALREYLRSHVDRRCEATLLFPDPAVATGDDVSSEATRNVDWPTLARRADILVGWRPSDEVLEAADRATLLINPGAGVQHIAERIREVNRDRSSPLRLANGHGNSYFTAQGIVALLLALTDRVVLHDRWLRAGDWRTGDSDAASIPLRGQRIGLLGYGAVNGWVHRFLSGFDVTFAALRRSWDPETERRTGPGDPPSDPPTELDRYTPDRLHPFLESADVLVTAVPLTEETEGLIGETELGLLGEDGLLVHAARGSVVEESALYQALSERQIAGAAIDVWWDYRPEPDTDGRRWPYDAQAHPFHELDNVVLSPHRAASPFGDLQRWDEVVENICRVADGRPILNEVDLDRGY